MTRWLRILGVVFLGLLLVAFAGWRVIDTGVTEYYSRDWHAESSAEAAQRGILLKRPVLPVRDLAYEGQPLHIRDAWIEQVTRIEYRWYLVPREIREAKYRLVLLADPVTGPRHYECDEWLAYGDSARFNSGADDFFDIVNPPLPDTVRLRVIRRKPAC